MKSPLLAALFAASIIGPTEPSKPIRPAHSAQWLILCDWNSEFGFYTCTPVWWPYYQHHTSQPDWCMWQLHDTVWLRWDDDYQNVISWYGVPAADLTTPPPLGYAPSNFTVVGCELVP